ncbi:MAG: peptide-binding protein [Pseudotabrizicola sp.]|uniref:COG3650 family protein n=1 Tax=Pseudotabrizicola sp. TaxID=2939647 RepID=UPI002731A5F5|nr:peptide-binding protein [Pseudotabrizicola sp.]MDP2083331.1 peptide-binding protein [Pseudotabrizicola sp.]MDZ7575866.1 peptide-binding protein [Pseudotabrizicola sp.]
MTRGFLLLSAVLWPGLALAQIFPSSYSVKGVSANDVLNIRAEPSATADIMDEIGPYSLNIEVLNLSPDGRWGRVGLPEGNGWVSMAFLDLIEPDDRYIVQRPLSCMGTEPFWSVSLYPRGAEYNSPDTGAVPMTVTHEAVAPEGFFVQLEEGPTLNRNLVITREACSDGMSDRAFGFATRMFTEAPDGNSALQGCCTLDHR